MNRKTTDRSLFFDDWRACLRAHYIYVIRANDRVTEPSLRQVLLQTGLNDDDLEALREHAYALGSLESGTVFAESEEVPAAESVENIPAAPAAEPGELVYDELGAIVETGNDEDIPIEEEPAEEEQTPKDESPPDYGRQLSLF